MWLGVVDLPMRNLPLCHNDCSCDEVLKCPSSFVKQHHDYLAPHPERTDRRDPSKPSWLKSVEVQVPKSRKHPDDGERNEQPEQGP